MPNCISGDVKCGVNVWVTDTVLVFAMLIK